MERLTARGASLSAVRRAARYRRLEAALARLPADHREVILLARVQGMSMSEISDRMGRSQDFVHLLILRALRELKQHYADLEYRLDAEARGAGRTEDE